MLRRDFQPSDPLPTPEEMTYAHDALVEFGSDNLPEDARVFWERKDTHGRELAAYLRSYTSEIIGRMLPEAEPLTLPKIMDILHVYYWWNDVYEEPSELLGEFLRDLDETRFFEAAELLHEEFRDLCAQQREIRGMLCKRTSVKKCLKESIELSRDDPSKTYATSWRRSEALLQTLQGIDFSEYIFQTDIAGADADELLEGEPEGYEDMFSYDPEHQRPLHSFASLLGRHAVARLVDAGLDDLEAMSATYVIDIEATLRQKGNAFGKEYIEFRNQGGTLDEFLQVTFSGDSLDNLITYMTEDEDAAKSMVPAEKARLLQRYLEETRDEWELLEDYYQLEENGIAPYYRRRFAEEHFPKDVRV